MRDVGVAVVDPPKRPFWLAVVLTSRPWAVIGAFSFGLFAVADPSQLTLTNLLWFLGFDFANLLLMNGWNDIRDYAVDHEGGTTDKPEYRRFGGWGHVVHRDQFKPLIVTIVLVNVPFYVYGFYVHPVACAVVLMASLGGNLVFNGELGLPHGNRRWFKNIVEYWIPITAWGWRVVVTGDVDLEWSVLVAYLFLFHLAQMRLDAVDTDRDRRNRKFTVAVLVGEKRIYRYLSVLRVGIALFFFFVYPVWSLLVFNVGRALWFWNRKDRFDHMIYLWMLLFIWSETIGLTQVFSP